MVVANVTLFPAARVNKPPKAILAPLHQTITLPTNKAIVDGTTSTDDTLLKFWLWEVVRWPEGSRPCSPSMTQSNITLTNLTAGNYTLRLTVTDEDGETDSTTATIEVVFGSWISSVQGVFKELTKSIRNVNGTLYRIYRILCF